jgi:hypothetical protein
MNSEVFRFKLGGFDCAIVNDGTYFYQKPGKALFENAPRAALAALKGHASLKTIRSSRAGRRPGFIGWWRVRSKKAGLPGRLWTCFLDDNRRDYAESFRDRKAVP